MIVKQFYNMQTLLITMQNTVIYKNEVNNKNTHV